MFTLNDYILRLCLDSPLYFSFVKFQLDKKLGKTYAGLLVFIEGMKSLGLIDAETYEYYRKRYDQPLPTSPIVKETPKCGFCGSPAVSVALHKSGIIKHVCEKHLKLVKDHQNWRINPAI